MIAKLDGQPVPLAAFWWPEMTFAQTRRDARPGQYELVIPRVQFVRRLQDKYQQCVADLRAGDQLAPDLVCPLRQLGYPPLGAVMQHPGVLEYLVRVVLYKEIFAAFLSLSPAARFMLDSVDSVTASAASLIVRGCGYHQNPADAKPS